jgi:hypothetical protein
MLEIIISGEDFPASSDGHGAEKEIHGGTGDAGSATSIVRLSGRFPVIDRERFVGKFPQLVAQGAELDSVADSRQKFLPNWPHNAYARIGSQFGQILADDAFELAQLAGVAPECQRPHRRVHKNVQRLFL